MKPFVVPMTRLVLAVVLAAAVCLPAAAQTPITEQDRDRATRMLQQLKKDLDEFYYDSTFAGKDIRASYARAEAAIQKAPSMSIAFGALAQFYADLNDSHTWFHPPMLAADVNYGFGTQAFWDTIRVVSVRKGSDAEAQGLKIGDRILAWDGMRADRGSHRLINYVYKSLSPREKVGLTVQSETDSAPRKLAIKASIKPRGKVLDLTNQQVREAIFTEMDDDERRAEHRYLFYNDSILYWRMPQFYGNGEPAIDDMMRYVRGKKAVIFDLRNNGGGAISTLTYLIGKFFDRDVPMMVLQARDSTRLHTAKVSDKNPYKIGMLVILVNSNSASSSEIFSRVLQTEGRAIVVGDRTAGAVVGSFSLNRSTGGGERGFIYVNQVSVINPLMPDGEVLEGKGVTPNHIVIPSAADLRLKRDPQLAKAFELVGVTMTSEEAGEFIRGRRKR